MKKPIYLDYMATTPVDPRVKEKMQDYLSMDGDFGNPASQHFYGYRAAEAVEKAREQVARLINASSKEIIWTSGATESNNLAIKGAVRFYQRKGKHIITCKTEHKAVLDVCAYLEEQGFEVTYLDVKSDGLLDLTLLKQVIRDDTVLISIMFVNNEIGVIQDIEKIGKLAHERGVIFHVDAAQAPSRVSMDMQLLPVDLMSFSSHKVYGPKGIGGLYVRRNPRIRLEPHTHGGGHERGLRSGTLPTHQIIGMGEAFRIAKEEMVTEIKHIESLRDRLWEGIRVLPKVYVNGDMKKRIAHNLNVSFEGVDGEALLLGLKDVAVSSGSACTSATIEPSHVLRALGISDVLAHSAIRFSLGRFTTEEEIDYTIKHVKEVVTRLRNMSPLWGM